MRRSPARRATSSCWSPSPPRAPGLINEHFGHAKEFQVYELSTAGAKFVGHRRVDLYCQGGYGEEDSLETIIRAINDCHAVFVAKIGGCPKADLHKAGIEPVDQFAHEFIEKSAIAWFKSYLDKVNSGEIEHVAARRCRDPPGCVDRRRIATARELGTRPVRMAACLRRLPHEQYRS